MFKKFIRFFASVKMAVVILSFLAILIAAGTFVESKYNAEIAAKLVYKTWFMYFVLSVLSWTLIAVMIDRWPWKKRHIPFLLAHVGILILLLGSLVTALSGLDGLMRFGIGESQRFVTLPETELQIWSSFDGERYTKLTDQIVDFYKNPPNKKPFKLDLTQGSLIIDEYIPFAMISDRFIASTSEKSGSAIRFQIKNDRVNVNEWLFQNNSQKTAVHSMGPAQFYLGPEPSINYPNENAVYFIPAGKKIKYLVTYKDAGRRPLRGELEEGMEFSPGWMGFGIKILRYLPRAEQSLEVKKLETPTEISSSAIQVSFLGKKQWVRLNDVVKFFGPDAVYIVTYANRKVDLGFALSLEKFEVGKNPGTMKAASYKSLVTTPENEKIEISMNEPLKYQGLTFYQASFQEGSDGAPIASILSVNYDPGRWLKYLGSLILSVGVVWLFYNRRKSARAQAPKDGVIS